LINESTHDKLFKTLDTNMSYTLTMFTSADYNQEIS